MKKVILYIATSIDGFIADVNGGIDWLNGVPMPKEETDYGYSDLMNSVGTIFMGANTYRQILSFDVPWPYEGKKVYVVSHDKELKITSPETEVLTHNIEEKVQEILSKEESNIWLLGGAQLNHLFLKHKLVNEIQVAVMPIILGKGVSLFNQQEAFALLNLLNSVSYSSGVICNSYEVIY